MGRPVEAVAAAGWGAAGPPAARRRRGQPGSEIVVQALPGRQLALSGDTGSEESGSPPSARVAAGCRPRSSAIRPPSAARRGWRRRAIWRGRCGSFARGWRASRRSRRSYGPSWPCCGATPKPTRGRRPASSSPGWFRATLVLIVLAIVVVITRAVADGSLRRGRARAAPTGPHRGAGGLADPTRAVAERYCSAQRRSRARVLDAAGVVVDGPRVALALECVPDQLSLIALSVTMCRSSAALHSSAGGVAAGDDAIGLQARARGPASAGRWCRAGCP